MRSAEPEAHKAIFADFAKQMAHVEAAVRRRLEELERALALPAAEAPDHPTAA